MNFKNVVVACAAALITACSSMATINSANEGTTVVLRDKSLVLPASEKVKGTSFGNYELKAVDAETGAEMYGILPLRFRPGHLVADILLFAPGLFFNLRDAFPYYEIDARNGVIRYKNEKNEAWTEYKPKAEEAARARAYFDAKQGGAASASSAAGSK